MIYVDVTCPLKSIVGIVTGRVRDQWHTLTRTGRSPRLASHLREPIVVVIPEDKKIYASPTANSHASKRAA